MRLIKIGICTFAAAVLTAAIGVSFAKQFKTKDIRLKPLITFDSESGEGGAEIAAYDRRNKLVLVTNGEENRIDMFSLNGAPATSVDMSAFGSGVQSVAVNRRGLAVAVVAANPVTEPGNAVFFFPGNPDAGSSVIPVGALPDMVTFTPDGRTVLVANEGEPRFADGDCSTITNPEGTVTIIDSAGNLPGNAYTVDFTEFNGQEDALRSNGIRVGTFPGASVAQDLEPEYITVSPDGKTAYVGLQENNALAVIDIRSGSVTEILGLGLKNHNNLKNQLDASNEDGAANIRNWPVQGMYMPDALTSWKKRGKTYIATANEGDGREYFADLDNDDEDDQGNDREVCFIDESRIKDITLEAGFPDPADYEGDLQDDENLGRLKISKFFPSEFVEGDGGSPPLNDDDPSDTEGLEYTKLANYGGRSVTIWDGRGNQVWDSGDQVSNKILNQIGEDAWVNGPVAGTTSEPDSRSDDKGPEPEAVAVGRVHGGDLLFLGLERSGGIMIFDVDNPRKPDLLRWVQSTNPVPDDDISPEGLVFVPLQDSPTRQPLLLAAFEISGTTVVYEVVECRRGRIKGAGKKAEDAICESN